MRMRKKKESGCPGWSGRAQWLNFRDPQALAGQRGRSLLPGAKELPEHPLDAQEEYGKAHE